MRLALDSGVPDLGTTNHRLHRQSNNPGLSPENTLPGPDQELDDLIDNFYTIFDDDNLTTSFSASEATESQDIVETSPAKDRTPDSVPGISTGRASQETGHRPTIDQGDQKTDSDLEITLLEISTPVRRCARNPSPSTPEGVPENTTSSNPGKLGSSNLKFFMLCNSESRWPRTHLGEAIASQVDSNVLQPAGENWFQQAWKVFSQKVLCRGCFGWRNGNIDDFEAIGIELQQRIKGPGV
ncbi:hypothetical protein V8E51_007700 [Hyaloscypha variabilis]